MVKLCCYVLFSSHYTKHYPLTCLIGLLVQIVVYDIFTFCESMPGRRKEVRPKKDPWADNIIRGATYGRRDAVIE